MTKATTTESCAGDIETAGHMPFIMKTWWMAGMCLTPTQDGDGTTWTYSPCDSHALQKVGLCSTASVSVFDSKPSFELYRNGEWSEEHGSSPLIFGGTSPWTWTQRYQMMQVTHRAKWTRTSVFVGSIASFSTLLTLEFWTLCQGSSFWCRRRT